MPRRLLALALCTLPLASPAGSPAEPSGPTGRVVCRADPHQSYALFVPSSYDPARAWPVLFCLDPRGRGALPVRLFAPAAEVHGYIVVGSNFAHRRASRANDAAIAALLRDVGERYAVDRGRVYFAGYAEGARAAARLGLTGPAKAVVACGGGFPDHAHTPPHLAFDLLGFADEDDPARGELRRIATDLRGTTVAHHLAVVPGSHQWLPESQTGNVLDWLDARHRHAAIRARYRNFATTLIQRRRTMLGDLPAPESYLACAALFDAAEVWLDRTELGRQRADLLRTLPDRGTARRLERAQRDLTRAWLRDAGTALDPLAGAERLMRWRDQAAGSAAGAEAMVARGVLVGAVLQACHQTAVALAEGRFAPDALHWAKLASTAEPESPLLAYQTACVAALAGNHAEAAALLRTLLRDGVIGTAEVEREPAFADSLARAEFRELISSPPR